MSAPQGIAVVRTGPAEIAVGVVVVAVVGVEAFVGVYEPAEQHRRLECCYAPYAHERSLTVAREGAVRTTVSCVYSMQETTKAGSRLLWAEEAVQSIA